MQTYSKFLGCLDLQHSSFLHYLGHQYHSQSKGTVLGCLCLQSSNQQLKREKVIWKTAITNQDLRTLSSNEYDKC